MTRPSPARWARAGRWWRWQGHRIFLRQAPLPDAPRLLLVHGYPVGSYDWHALWGLLAGRVDLTAPDLLGMGLSDKPATFAYRLDDHAGLIRALLAQDGRPVHLVGFDLGVTVIQWLLAGQAQAAAGGDPPVASVTFLNGGLVPSAYHPRPVQRLLASPLGAFIGPRLPRRAFDRAMADLFPGDAPPQGLLDDFWRLVCHRRGLAAAWRVGRFWRERLPHEARLIAATTPLAHRLLLINGSADPNSGRHMVQAYRAHHPDVPVLELPGVGHWPQVERPEAVAQAILDHVHAHHPLRPAGA